VLFPRLATRLWIGTPSPAATATMRMVGARDVALGLGAIAGVREGAQAPEWMGWGAAADGIDALALLVTPGLAKRARLLGIVSAGAAAVGMVLAWELADERAATEVEARHAARLAAIDAGEH
jgi:hypothetical protein